MADDYDLEIKEYVEIISTDDERLKIIGEELGNDTGRAIFTAVSRQAGSPNDLAKTLNISLPLVNWHINRLMGVGLVRIEKLGTSPKNKPIKYYGSAKTILVIVSAAEENDHKDGKVWRSRADIAWSKLARNLVPIVSFIAGTSVIYAIQNMLNGQAGIKLADPDAISSIPAYSLPSDIAVALFGGAVIGATILLATKFLQRIKNRG